MSSELNRAIAHSVNYHSLDAKLSMSDFAIADLLEPEIQKYIDGETDVQYFESMLKKNLNKRIEI